MKYLQICYMTLVIILILLFAAVRASAQKPVIDTSVYEKLGGLRASNLNNDGEYVYYESYDKRGCWVVHIKATHDVWTKEITDVKIESFANEGHLFIAKVGQDSLCLQTLGSDQQEVIPHVSSFKVSRSGKAEWLMYQLNNPGKELVLRNLATGNQRSFSNVTDYQFSNMDQAVLLQQARDSVSSLGWLDLNKDVLTAIWQGKSPGGFKFTSDGKAMAFSGSSDVPGKKSVWYYKSGDEKARLLITENSADDLTQGLILEYLRGFNSTGDKLFFIFQPIKSVKIRNPKLASVDIFSYKDPKLQSQQLQELQSDAVYTYVFDLAGHKLIALQKENEHLMIDFNNLRKQDYVLLRKDGDGDVDDEWNWNPAALTSVYLVNVTDGTRKCLSKDQPALVSHYYQLSPDERYVIYYNAVKRDYYCYTIASGITRNITKGAGADWTYGESEDWPDSIYVAWPRYHWAVNDQAIFIKSKDDIYQADPSGKLPVIRLTGNYGRNHHLEFSIPESFKSRSGEIDLHAPLLLKVLNEDTKEEGFCQVIPGRENKPELLKMMPYHLNLYQKARDAEVYMGLFESAENSPNVFLTTDFKAFTPLTDIHPEMAFNWMSSQLITFKTLDGKATQGILYKPENFDPKKKYPLIFFYYERKSDDLHKFRIPEYSDGGSINIPTYVSNGYLIFLPDIHYKIGYPGRSALNSIVSAAEYIAQFPWVDKRHMGLMGHSFGGFETNYVITHSHLFAAAVAMSGMTDFVSAYGSIIGDGTCREHQYELYKDRIGATLWQRPDLYLENSPVFKADKVTTPVLLMANIIDGDVPYEQGVEFFTALRRLGKKAWMLRYDKGDHQVTDPTDKKDLTLRMQQFFDYYLKGEPAPKWMVEGIPAGMKGIDSGYELMPGREP
jgi:dipeptidyl aminopeptidase/acylaminoacyl peptidase